MADTPAPERAGATSPDPAVQERRQGMTQEALADVDAGRLIDDEAMQAWADRLGSESEVPPLLPRLQEASTRKADIDQGLADLAAGRVQDFDAARIAERGRKLLAEPGGARHGRGAEAEVRDTLEQDVEPPNRVRLGDALAALGRDISLTNEDIAFTETKRDRTPAEPRKFE